MQCFFINISLTSCHHTEQIYLLNKSSSHPMNVKKRSCGLWTLVEPPLALGPAGVRRHSHNVSTMGIKRKTTHYYSFISWLCTFLRLIHSFHLPAVDP